MEDHCKRHRTARPLARRAGPRPRRVPGRRRRGVPGLPHEHGVRPVGRHRRLLPRRGRRLRGLAHVVDRRQPHGGNDPFYLAGGGDRQSLRIAEGATATSPTFCADVRHPDFRFVARPLDARDPGALDVLRALPRQAGARRRRGRCGRSPASSTGPRRRACASCATCRSPARARRRRRCCSARSAATGPSTTSSSIRSVSDPSAGTGCARAGPCSGSRSRTTPSSCSRTRGQARAAAARRRAARGASWPRWRSARRRSRSGSRSGEEAVAGWVAFATVGGLRGRVARRVPGRRRLRGPDPALPAAAARRRGAGDRPPARLPRPRARHASARGSAGRSWPDRLVTAGGDAWYAVGPALVFLAAGAPGARRGALVAVRRRLRRPDPARGRVDHAARAARARDLHALQLRVMRQVVERRRDAAARGRRRRLRDRRVPAGAAAAARHRLLLFSLARDRDIRIARATRPADRAAARAAAAADRRAADRRGLRLDARRRGAPDHHHARVGRRARRRRRAGQHGRRAARRRAGGRDLRAGAGGGRAPRRGHARAGRGDGRRRLGARPADRRPSAAGVVSIARRSGAFGRRGARAARPPVRAGVDRRRPRRAPRRAAPPGRDGRADRPREPPPPAGAARPRPSPATSATTSPPA